MGFELEEQQEGGFQMPLPPPADARPPVTPLMTTKTTTERKAELQTVTEK